jgi:hypothetical protein
MASGGRRSRFEDALTAVKQSVGWLVTPGRKGRPTGACAAALETANVIVG